MTHSAEPSATTDPAVLTGAAYRDGSGLAARRSLYDWQTPRHDLPGIVAEALTGVRGAVADVGCGSGAVLRRLAQARPDLTLIGVDLSAGILSGVPVPVAVADVEHLPFSDGRLGAALALHMLYHARDIPAAVAELRRVVAPGGLVVVSTNSGTDKRELDQLWRRASGDVLGVPEGPSRVTLSSRFRLEDAQVLLADHFASVRVLPLPGTITVTDPEPVIAHLASYRAWAAQAGVPFDATIQRAREILDEHIRTNGCFTITCLGGILICA
ncbi:class I SAM-dependent methyltransferase [Allostreptomyces psammosilenae]|uniref:SAM-dependent methyltransferase n=1 Tax=Allostreptomyces psammosilenae TaxID=1892865 RepID=A0A853A4Y1_9ACTN|nr:class I SAM-dependent methyltransferase [Allostreptomyces psammosilenae]NYI05552.1 SAM-dependent methyltransferase [Allostreptomyces psammosilenae]